MARTRRAVLSLVTWSILAAPALAQWSPDPTLNNPVAVASDTQSPVVAVTDGAGGAIFIWRSERFDINTFTFVYDLRAQRISAAGVVQWAPTGVLLVTDTVSAQATLLRPPFSVVPDGSGGAVVAWRDIRNPPDTGDIFAQRISGAGAPMWTAGGLAIAAVTALQQKPVVVADGSGGAIIAWEDSRNGVLNRDVFAQRVDGAGAPQWTANGVAVCTAAGDQLLPVVTTDGAGGAIIAWNDNRGSDGEIFAQKMLAAGTPGWTADGVAITNIAGTQTRPHIATDNSGGAFIAWEDSRNAGDNDVYARRVASSGTPQWALDGVQIAATANATFPVVVADLLGAAIIVWTDERNGAGNTDVFAQRVNAGGIVQWAGNGVSVCGATGGQFFPAATSDGTNGVVIGWEDGRSGPSDVFAQRLNVSGAALWAADGRPVSTAADAQGGVTVAPDGSGGGILAWADGRNALTTGIDVFAAHVDGSGGLPVTLESFSIE